MNYSKECGCENYKCECKECGCECEKFVCVYSKMKNARTNERDRIIKMIKKCKDWEVKDGSGSGHGIKNYGKNRMPEYNLENWMYIEFEIPKLNKWFCLDLQSFDTDPDSGNMHLLDQRISLYSSNKKNSKTKFLSIPSYKDKEDQEKAFDLPLGDEEIKKLLDIIDEYTADNFQKPTFKK